MENKSLHSLLKYPGGKGSELVEIQNYLPQNINNYIEPFVGGGAVYFSIIAKKYFINDISEDLMNLYRYIKEQNKEFFDELHTIINNWEALGQINEKSTNFFSSILKLYKEGKLELVEVRRKIESYFSCLSEFEQPLFALENMRTQLFKEKLVNNLASIVKRICRNEMKLNRILSENEILDNFECAIKSAYYMYFRDLYNHYEAYNLSLPRKVAIYLFIREYCYSSMFRFNKEGHFNVPYGGISYNKKTLRGKEHYYHSQPLLQHLALTQLYIADFYNCVSQIKMTQEDFMFLDPPYDTVFSEYDKNSFGKSDQIRLANYLIKECPCKFMLVIKKTEFISNLYLNKGLRIIETNKNYFVSFKNRNTKSVKHLIIMNY